MVADLKDQALVEHLIRSVNNLRDEHNQIIANVDNARSRVVTIESLYEQLLETDLERREYLETAIRCAEHSLYRPAIITSWMALFHRLLEITESDEFRQMESVRPKWAPIGSREGLIENHSEFQIIEASKAAGYIEKSFEKSMKGYLHRRNQSAHPTSFRPTLNTTLGYLEDIITSLDRLSGQSVPAPR